MKSTNPVLKNQTIVIFDGECLICNAFFRFLFKRDRKKVLKYATIQSEFAGKLIKEHFDNTAVPDSILLWHNNKLYIKSTAAIQAISLIGGFWMLIKVLFIFPLFLRNIVYDFIARNRYKWFSKRSCIILQEDWKSQFIN